MVRLPGVHRHRSERGTGLAVATRVIAPIRPAGLVRLFASTHARALAAALLLAAGCASEADEEAANDHIAPVVEVHSPERGTVAEGADSVVVTGVAIDHESSVEQVTVNGIEAELDADGSFRAQVPLTPGITLIETVATDRGGNQASDARATLSGQMAAQGQPVAEAIAAYISSDAMAGLAALVDDYASAIDLTAVATSYNPVKDTGDSCNDYKVYVDSVERGNIAVTAGGAAGGIDAQVEIHDLVVSGHVDFEALCVSGSADYVMSASVYRAGGLVAPRLVDGAIEVDLTGVTSAFSGFDLEVEYLPGFIESQIEDDVRDEVAAILREEVESAVPPMASQFLSGFVDNAFSTELLATQVDISVRPVSMTWNQAGGVIIADSQIDVAGAEGTMYLSTPRPTPADAAMDASALRIAVADDALNQLFGGMWAAGAVDSAMLPGTSEQLSAALGGDVAQASLSMKLPPVASFDTAVGTSRLTFGDIIVEALDPSGNRLVQFAVSAEIELGVEPRADGTMRIITGTPRILAQVLEQSDQLLTELDAGKIAAIAELVIRQLALRSDELLAQLPVPGLGGVSIEAPSLQAVGGYLVVGGELGVSN